MNISHEQKLRILTELIRIAGADGQHRDEEYDLLHRITELLDVEPMDMEALFTKPSETDLPKDEVHRISLFFHLVTMVLADGEISYDEIVLLRELTLKLGFRPQALDEVIKRLDDWVKFGIPEAEFIQIFQVHHN
jgi:uncharacterized tellurite resistance protein B-like protein